jgi:hypothetical protein
MASGHPRRLDADGMDRDDESSFEEATMGKLKVVQVSPTPNPMAMKFTLSGKVSDKPLSYTNAQAASASPIASKVFALDGVASVFMVQDFVTVNRTAQANWNVLAPLIQKTLDEVLP